MLSIKVKTTQELMSIALQAERQTVQRYARLSEDMRAAGNDSAADLFERMVDEEREHERRLMAWMASESISEIPATGPIRWRDPQVSTTYDDEARDPHYSTPYKALAFAVNNEDNAFRFYTHVAAEAEDESVRLCAEALAHEELEHAELFRAERRRAYHAERATGAARPPADPGVIHSEADLLATALRLDGYFCDAVGRLGEDSSALLELLGEARQQVAANESLLEGLPVVARPPPDALLCAITGNALSVVVDDPGVSVDVDAELRHLRICCDRSFVFYDAVVESTGDESIMHSAQALASVVLDRSSALQQLVRERSLPREG
jgi:rubrerythrin